MQGRILWVKQVLTLRISGMPLALCRSALGIGPLCPRRTPFVLLCRGCLIMTPPQLNLMSLNIPSL